MSRAGDAEKSSQDLFFASPAAKDMTLADVKVDTDAATDDTSNVVTDNEDVSSIDTVGDAAAPEKKLTKQEELLLSLGLSPETGEEKVRMIHMLEVSIHMNMKNE